MKSFVSSILTTGLLALVASPAIIAQTSNTGFEQWYRAKYGRPSPTEQARLNAVPQQAAFPAVAATSDAGFDQWYRAKYGRPSPAEEARLELLPVNTATPAAKLPMVMVSVSEPADTPTLGKSELNTLIATAKTPAQHERIAQDYRDQAQNYLAQAQAHAAMVAMYKANPGVNAKNQAATINHCEYFAAKLNGLAAKSEEQAQMHEQMAGEAGRK
jgi:hypothetical protein